MSRSLGNQLPQRLIDHVANPASAGEAVPIVSLDADGMPRPAMVSGRELEVGPSGALSITLWRGTHTALNLEARPEMAAILICDGAAYYLRARARKAQDTPDGTVEFALELVEVLEDRYPDMDIEPIKIGPRRP